MKKIIEENGEKHLVDFQGKYIGKGTIRDATPEEIAQGEKKNKDDGDIQVSYFAMVDGIHNKKIEFFGTKQETKIVADIVTWEAMLKRPQNFLDTDLGFAKQADVTDYATEKLNTADAYFLYRLQELNNFKTAKAAIQG